LCNAPDNDQNEAANVAAGAVGSADEQPALAHKTEQPHKTQHTWLEKSAVAIAVLAFLAAAGQGWIARDTEQRSLRAYIFLPPDNEIDVVAWPSTTSASEIQVNVKNMGQGPAYDAIGRAWMGFDVWPPPKNFNYGGPPDPNGDSSVIIPPGGIVHYHTGTARALTIDEMTELQAGTKTIYVYGNITYNDAFGHSRHTNFCLGSASGVHRTYKTAIARCPLNNDAN
jgi:hypothetical protein